MTYPYAGDGRPYTGPSYRAMAILALIGGLTIGVLLALADYAAAAQDQAPCRGCPTPSEIKRLNDFIAKQSQAAPTPELPVKVAPPAVDPPPVTLPPPVAVAPAATPAAAAPSPVTVSSGPGGETTVSVGTLAGQALSLILSVLALPIGGYVVVILQRVLTNLKIPITDAARAKIKEMAVNGINLAAATAQTQLAGQGNIVIRNAAVADAVKYVQAHGADTIKQLGLDPSSPQAQEAIKAWVETVIADPSTPTSPVLDPPNSPGVHAGGATGA